MPRADGLDASLIGEHPAQQQTDVILTRPPCSASVGGTGRPPDKALGLRRILTLFAGHLQPSPRAGSGLGQQVGRLVGVALKIIADAVDADGQSAGPARLGSIPSISAGLPPTQLSGVDRGHAHGAPATRPFIGSVAGGT
jgi:hypothetical protein